MKHDVEFFPSGRGKAQCPSDPNYPNGLTADMTRSGEPGCWVDLPYPAPECGFFAINCVLCHVGVAITAAGRPDDPRRVKIPCLPITEKAN